MRIKIDKIFHFLIDKKDCNKYKKDPESHVGSHLPIKQLKTELPKLN